MAIGLWPIYTVIIEFNKLFAKEEIYSNLRQDTSIEVKYLKNARRLSC